MGDTSIEWTDKVWNPVTGCTKVSQGCKHCYAERFFPRAYPGRKFGKGIWCHPERLDQPLRWKKPARIFVNSMSDLFHEAVPFEFIDRVWAVMLLSPQHTYQILTKRPGRAREYLSDASLYQRVLKAADEFRYKRPQLNCIGISNPKTFPAKWIHLGVSVEDQPTAEERIPELLQSPAEVRFISAEPLLGPIEGLQKWFCCEPASKETHLHLPCIDWVIAGGESGPGARPMHPDWARSLRDQCAAAGVPFFFKQWGEWKPVCAQYPKTEAEHEEAENASLCGDICVGNDGYIWPENYQPSVAGRPWLMNRVGKKAAGAILDGREHREFPR